MLGSEIETRAQLSSQWASSVFLPFFFPEKIESLIDRLAGVLVSQAGRLTPNVQSSKLLSHAEDKSCRSHP